MLAPMRVEEPSVYPRPAGRLSVSRVALATAITMTTIYILYWSAAFAGARELPHLYARMLRTADLSSAYALLEGLVWSWVGGVLAGTIAALAFVPGNEEYAAALVGR